MKEQFMDGMVLAAGICTGTVVFEWTRRAVRALLGTFFRFVGRWGAKPKFLKGRG